MLNKHHFKGKPLPADAIFIGRPSVFGNPFSHQSNTAASHKVATRDEAVRSYAHWLAYHEDAASAREKIREMAALVAAGEGITLLCYCSPLACHGDIIKHHIFRIANDLLQLK